jgi:hypothetical protein
MAGSSGLGLLRAAATDFYAVVTRHARLTVFFSAASA